MVTSVPQLSLFPGSLKYYLYQVESEDADVCLVTSDNFMAQ